MSPGGGLLYLFFIARPFPDILVPIPSVTPLVLEEFSRELAELPSHKRRYVLNGIQVGFRVGWEPQRVSLRSRASNMRSATDHPDVVDEYLGTDLAAGWLAGPFSSPLHYDRFMLVLLTLFPKTINLGSGALIWTSPLHSATALTTAFRTILFIEIRNCGRRDSLVSRFGSWRAHGKIRRDSRLSQYPHPPPFCVTVA